MFYTNLNFIFKFIVKIEELKENTIKEVKEEAGLDVTVVRIIAVSIRLIKHVKKYIVANNFQTHLVGV